MYDHQKTLFLSALAGFFQAGPHCTNHFLDQVNLVNRLQHSSAEHICFIYLLVLSVLVLDTKVSFILCYTIADLSLRSIP